MLKDWSVEEVDSEDRMIASLPCKEAPVVGSTRVAAVMDVEEEATASVAQEVAVADFQKLSSIRTDKKNRRFGS